jgi:hypothetical protein
VGTTPTTDDHPQPIFGLLAERINVQMLEMGFFQQGALGPLNPNRSKFKSILIFDVLGLRAGSGTHRFSGSSDFQIHLSQSQLLPG